MIANRQIFPAIDQRHDAIGSGSRCIGNIALESIGWQAEILGIFFGSLGRSQLWSASIPFSRQFYVT